MFGSKRNRALTLALAVALTGACETGTEPSQEGSFDALAALADYEAMDEAFSSEAMSRFRALSSGVTLSDVAPEVRMAFKMGEELSVPGGQDQARTMAEQILTAASQAGDQPQNSPIISGLRRGKTFVYDSGLGRYVIDENLLGAPETGVRFIYYARGADGKPDPTQELGYADLIDEGDSSAEDVALRLVVVEGSATLIDYRTTLDLQEEKGAITLTGFLQGEQDRLTFDIQVQGSETGGTAQMDVDFEFGISQRDFMVTGSVSGMESSSGEGGEISIRAKHGKDSFHVEAVGTESSIDGTVQLNGALFATITGNPDDPTITGATGEPLTFMEALVLHQIIDGAEDAFDFFEDLMDPIDELVLLAIIL